MPTGLHLWSRTAASNATADSSINWAEGQSPSSVNDSARAMMARIAEWRDDLGGLTTSGSSTAYTVSSNRGFASLAAMDKSLITIVPHTTCGAAPTLNVDGLTAKQIRTATGVNVAAGALVAGTPYALIYFNATTEFILLGVAVTLGSLDITGAAALTAPDTADEAALYDASAAANRKITLANLLKVIDTLTAKTTLAAADEVAIYDVAGTAAKKATLTTLFAAIDSLTEKTSPVALDKLAIFADGTGKKVSVAELAKALPAFTTQYLTSGTSATYTTPANCRAIKVRMCGGGGGGNGTGATAGGTTTFNGINANGGSNNGVGGSGGSGAASFRLAGGSSTAFATNAGHSGSGGTNPFGGSGRGSQDGSGATTAGAANTGAGGGGARDNSGGGAGEYVEILIQNPDASYTYTVGAGGTGGTGAFNGKAGSSGVIIVEEYY